MDYHKTRATCKCCDRRMSFISSDEAAEVLGISQSTFRRSVKKGILPQPCRLGGRRLWNLSNLVSAVESTDGERAPITEGHEVGFDGNSQRGGL